MAPMSGASGDKLERIKEYQIYIYDIGVPIGKTAEAMPLEIKDDRNLINPHIAHDKCVFACIGLYFKMKESDKDVDTRNLSAVSKKAFKQWCEFNNKQYSLDLYKSDKGVEMMDFDKLEACFNVGIDVYHLTDIDTSDMKGKYARVSYASPGYKEIIPLIVHEGHAVLIKNADKVNRTFICKKCQMVFDTNKDRLNHEAGKCEQTELIQYVKEVSAFKPSDNKILAFIDRYDIKDLDHYIDNFIVYDFEAILAEVEKKVEGDDAKTTFVSEHIPVSVSICDSLTRECKFFVNEDPKQLVDDMITVNRSLEYG
ncbi:hypothetical protein DYB28_000614 [Aphanomyces astaci]|uniref:Uncharacterized protein n=1 Tax=Aphanomyces astaci TaxID=112090 RepID=A0A9X8DJX6_APHAT|nr:hypothetical protein DYB28_000614 [Aphanomyces astaci]